MTPSTNGEIAQLLAREFDGLSPQLRRAAQYLLDHPDDVALHSMRDIAAAAGLPPVTFVRLARSLGLADYQALRARFQARWRNDGAGRWYSQGARALQAGEAQPAGLLKTIYNAEIENLELTFGRNHPESMTGIADQIWSARRLLVLGQRSLHPAAQFFHYVYDLMRDNARLASPFGAQAIDDTRRLGQGDMLLVFSMAPYSVDVVTAARLARDRGASVIAVTDDPLSPVARAAQGSLMLNAASPSFFHSILPAVSIAQALLALLVARGGKEAVAAIEASERHLAHFGAYWNDDEETEK